MKFQDRGHYTFDNQLKIGHQGENLIINHCNNCKIPIRKVKIEIDRHAGIDLYIDDVPVQIKYEKNYARYPNNSGIYYTGNLALELWSDKERAIIGGHLSTRAQKIIHLFGDMIAVVLNTVQTKHFIINNLNKYRICKNESENWQWYSETLLVPFPDLINKNIIVEEFTLNV